MGAWRIDRRGIWTRRGYARQRLTPWRAAVVWALLPPLTLLALYLAVHRRSNGPAELARYYLGDAWQAPEQADEEISNSLWTTLENLVRAERSVRKSPLRRVDLQLEQQALELLERAEVRGDRALGRQPGGDRPYVQALYRESRGPWQVAKVGYRGISRYHHLSEKPSFRVRLRKRDQQQGRRHVELLRPEDPLALCNALPQALARELGLMSEPCEPARVFVNGRPFGVYLYAERPTERVAISQGRLPGTFWKGDFAEREEDVGSSSVLNLWRSAARWKSVEDPVAGSREAIEGLLARLRLASREPWAAEDAEALATVLDTEAYARFEAYNAVVGGIHVDVGHNQIFFWNTYRGRLEPVAWDVNGYGFSAPAQLTPNVCQHPITARLYSDPTWVHRRDQILHELVRGPCSLERELQRLRAYLARVLPALREDPLVGKGSLSDVRLTSLGALNERAQEVEAWIRARHAFLNDYFGIALAFVEPAPDRPGWSRVSVDGAMALRVCGGPEQGRLLFPGMSAQMRTHLLPSGANVSFLVPVPKAYLVRGVPAELALENAITGGAVRLQPAPRKASDQSRSFEPTPAEPESELRLGPGLVELRESLHLGPHRRLRIEAGSVVRLHSGVGIYAQAPVHALGTSEQPIRLEPASDAPWACVGLFGEGTRGSRFEHVEVSGGSVGSDGSRRFLGMVSAYFCPDLTLRDCRFGTNSVGDDAVNLAQTRVLIERCAWRGARSDGLDLDRCEARITDSEFSDCGNDGLDLSHGQVLVQRSRFRACGDKGVSAGEGTQTVLEAVSIEGCDYGVQAKDASFVVVRGAHLTRNRVGVHAYRKKVMFQLGGVLLLAGSEATQNAEADLRLDPHSYAFLAEGSSLPRRDPPAGPRLHEVGAVPLVWSTLEARVRAKAP